MPEEKINEETEPAKETNLVQEEEDPEPKKGSGAGMVVVLIIVIALIVAAVGFLGFKCISSSKATVKASPTASKASLSSTTSAQTVSPVSNASAVRDQALSDLARKHFDWVIAEQKSGEDLMASQTYMNAAQLGAEFKNLVESRWSSTQINPLTMGTEKISRYTIDSNYANVDGSTGQINCTVYSDTMGWNVVIIATKENGGWIITDIGAAG